jgi:predicted Rossmann fold nucleotide-binding protein DprA/Smf involved in DNA uptake
LLEWIWSSEPDCAGFQPGKTVGIPRWAFVFFPCCVLIALKVEWLRKSSPSVMKFANLESLGVNPVALHRGLPNYPGRLTAFLHDQAPPTLWVAGDVALLELIDSGKENSLAVLSSAGAPARITESMLTLVRRLAGSSPTFIGGFHSDLERCCLSLLLKEDRRVAVCLARTLVRARVPGEWLGPLHQRRLVILSPFAQTRKRPTVESAEIRNRCVAALASRILVLFAAPGSKTEALCQNLVSSGKTVWALDVPENETLLRLGAQPVSSDFLDQMNRSAT